MVASTAAISKRKFVAEDPAHPGQFLTRNIEDLKVGDLVLTRSQDDPTAPLERRPILQTYVHVLDSLRILTVTDAQGHSETIRTTDAHPFFVPGNGWREAGTLQAGDHLMDADGNILTVCASTTESRPEGIPVYNFEVEGDHTYFVSALSVLGLPTDSVWVHNSYGAGRAGKQMRLKQLLKDPNISSELRGWIKQETNAIARGTRVTIRVPPGFQLAHMRGFEAKKGFSYLYSNLQEIGLHKLQHALGGF